MMLREDPAEESSSSRIYISNASNAIHDVSKKIPFGSISHVSETVLLLDRAPYGVH